MRPPAWWRLGPRPLLRTLERRLRRVQARRERSSRASGGHKKS